MAEVDLQLRSNRGRKGNDHGREERFVERKNRKPEEEAGAVDVVDGDAHLDRKRKQRPNAQLGSLQQLVTVIDAPPISTTTMETEFNASSHQLHHHCSVSLRFSPIRCFYWQSNNGTPTVTPLAFSFINLSSLFG
ncbi:hypothetical protein ACE6H2_002519 [Prunus campanulata]